jgi:hypothetical protein
MHGAISDTFLKFLKKLASDAADQIGTPSSVDHFRVLQEGPAGGLNMPAGGPADGVRPCEIRQVPAGVPAGR